MTRRTALTLPAVALSAAASPHKRLPPSLEPEIARWMEVARVPGMALAITDRNRTLAVKVFGLRKTDTADRVTEDTVFEAASLSKPVFASTVLQLREEGKLDLDKPLHNDVPIEEADDLVKKVTARHVLSHSTGWVNWRFKPGEPLRCAFEPGSRFGYSGEGFVHLQRVVEKLTGQSVEQLLQARVYERLGLKSTSMVWRDDLAPRFATGHTGRGRPTDDFGARTAKWVSELAAERGVPVSALRMEQLMDYARARKLPSLPVQMPHNVAGSVRTTAAEYAIFLRHAMSLPEMRKPLVKVASDLSWALGMASEGPAGRETFSQWGDNQGFKNIAIANAAENWGIVILTNGDGGAKVWSRVVRSLIDRDPSIALWA